MIGAYLDQSVGSKSGSAFVFGLVNGRWKEKQKLTSMLTSSADYFGQDVSIFENHIVVGAYGMCVRPLSLIGLDTNSSFCQATVIPPATTMEPLTCSSDL